MTKTDWLKLLTCVGVCLLAGLIGGLATRSALVEWYPYLVKPRVNPPAWVFGPVWTALYLTLAVATFLVWRRGIGRRGVNVALVAAAGQLALTAAWAPVFFGLRSIEGGLLVALALMFAVLLTILLFTRVAWTPAMLLVSYLLWVMFAIYLNGRILALNGFKPHVPTSDSGATRPA
ncbi:MAG TPA: TspO/MBR family protein [Tepidisphaeraceae bacterium]|nr:TspO/MBR family protein [Tepidisphaeraceae bacterium]